MPTSVPDSVSSVGTVRLKWLPAVAAVPTISLATDVNATGAVDLECYLKEMFSSNSSQESVDDSRMCSKQVFAKGGTYTYSIDNLVIVYDVQNAAAVSNKAYATLLSGAKGFLLARWGKDVDTAYAVGDKVDLYPVELGRRFKLPPEANSQLKASVPVFVTGPVLEDQALSA